MNFMNKGKKALSENQTEEQQIPTKHTNSNQDQLRKKMLFMIAALAVLLIVIFLIVFLVRAIGGSNLSYQEIENRMKNAAIKYYEENESFLPDEEGNSAEVSADTLADNGFMDPLSKLRQDDECEGTVVVELVNGEYHYTPYLECGTNYVTKELYQAVIDQDTVATGDGLYQMNGEYVFRGENVNNYVQLDNQLFRIVKVTADHEVLIIPEFNRNQYLTYTWDDRYNTEANSNVGINSFDVSRIYDYLQEIYKTGQIGSMEFLSDNDKEKLVPYDLCMGKRSEQETNNTNTLECTSTIPNQMIGLLTVSDYLNASSDLNCHATTDRVCQNYNYLSSNVSTNWWLMTASTENTYGVYYVSGGGYVNLNSAINYYGIRPTIMLGSQVMIESGDGSSENPYHLR